MSTPLFLKAFVNERLTAAAEEIFQVFEKTITKYEDEVCSSRQEIERLRGLLLDFTANHKTDPPQPPICKEETAQEHHFKQEPSSSLGWRDPDPPHIKQEDPERWDDQQEDVQEFKSFDWRKNQQEDPEVSLESHIQNSEREEQLEALQETKSVQFTIALASTPSSPSLIQNDTHVPDDTESERPAASFTDSNQTLTDDSQVSFITSRGSVDLPYMYPVTANHRCDLCDKSFASSQHLRNHICHVPPNEAGIGCRVCGKIFESSDSLNVHIMTHKGSTCCHVCGKRCNSITVLTEHMARHSGVKLHRCHVCGKECGRKGDLKIHMRIHTGEKPFCCSYCHKSFTHSGHLRKHMRSHTGERPYQCDVCGRGFLQSTHLKYHLGTHTQKY